MCKLSKARKSFRLYALIMSVMLTFSLMAGCGGTAAPEAENTAEAVVSPTAEPQEQPAANETGDTGLPESSEPVKDTPAAWPEVPLGSMSLPLCEEPVTITLWMGINPNVLKIIDDPVQDCAIYSEIASRTGVALSFITAHPDTERENFNLICVSGDLPDIFNNATTLYSGAGEAAINDGVLIDHLPYITKEDTPQLYQLLIEEGMVDDLLTSSGYLPGLPGVSQQDEATASFGPMIRKDWLDKLGLEVPETLDQLHDVLVAFKDELGATAPLAINYASTGLDNGLVSAFGFPATVTGNTMGATAPYFLKDGKIDYGAAQPGFKDYLQMIHDWYAEGLIWADYNTYTDFQNPPADIITTNQCGVFFAENIFISQLEKQAADPDFELIAIPNFVLKEGGTIPLMPDSVVRATLTWSITTGCEDPQLVAKLANYFFTDEGALLCNYGIEGESFVYDESGQPVFTDLILNNPEMTSTVALFMYCMDRGPFYRDELREQSGYTQAEKDAGTIWRSNYVTGAALPTYNLTVDETEELNRIYPDIQTYVSEKVLKFVFGIESLDSYDSYVQMQYDMGLDQVLEIQQTAYDRYMSGEIVEAPDPGPPPDGPPPA